MNPDLVPLRRRFRLATTSALFCAVALAAATTAQPRAASNATGITDLTPVTGASTPAATAVPVAGSTVEPSAAPGSQVGQGGSVAGPTSSSATGGGAGGNSVPGPGNVRQPADGSAVLTATDQGVTATTIKIAHFRVNPSFYAQYGLPDPKIEQSTKAYTDYINSHGGINGRKWVPDMVTINSPLQSSDIQGGCTQAFQQDHDFLYVGTLQYEGLAECAASAGRGATDLGLGGLSASSDAALARLGGRYWVAGMSSDRFVKIWADFLKKTYGNKTKVGLLVHYDETLKEAANLMVKALEADGFPPPSVFVHTSDTSTAAIQVQNAIAQYKRDGVQLIAPFTNAIVLGIAQHSMTANGYRPSKGWTFSSIAAADVADGAVLLDASQMEGARGIGLFRTQDEPQSANCKQIYLAAYPGASWYQENANECQMIFQTAEALRHAGTHLTLSTWAQASAAVASYLGNVLGRLSFSATKRDGADEVRPELFTNGAFSVTGDYRRSF